MKTGIKHGYAYLPEHIAQAITELAATSKGNTNLRYDNYLKIVSTIYFKCINENNYPYVHHALGKGYWRKVIGGRYRDYIDELLEHPIIAEIQSGRSKLLAIDTNLHLNHSEVIPVEYRNITKDDSKADKRYSSHSERPEERLGNRILAHLKHVSVDYDAFENDLQAGKLRINAEKYEMDITRFPMDMDISGEVHYHNSIEQHSYMVKTLIEKSNELRYFTYYDKDKIKVMASNDFATHKYNGLINHAKLNLLKLIGGSFELSRDINKTRRIFHVGVTLPSKVLPYVRIKGERVVGIDAKTSQFLLLAILFKSFVDNGDAIAYNFEEGKRRSFIKELYTVFKEHQSKESYLDDVKRFYQDVVEKDLYGVIQGVLGLSQRSQAKIFCFKIIFSSPDSKNEFKDIIRDRYPSIVDTLDEYKRLHMKRNRQVDKDGSEKLSINLQALESEIFIEGIFNQLHENKITCFTRHDSVIVGESTKDKAKEIMKNYYKQLGFESNFEVEDYTGKEEEQYIDIDPTHYDFLEDIEDESEMRSLGRDEMYLLLEQGNMLYTENIVRGMEHEINEANRFELSISDNTYSLLYKIIIKIKTIINTY